MIRSAEAFCLMLYRNVATGREEWLWNSRDGVTPFSIPDPVDGGEMRHADWYRDVYAPFHLPMIGSRVFADITPASAREHAKRWIALVDGPDFREHPAFAGRSDEEIVAEKALALLEHGGRGAPDVLTVDEQLQAKFREQRPARVSDGRHA